MKVYIIIRQDDCGYEGLSEPKVERVICNNKDLAKNIFIETIKADVRYEYVFTFHEIEVECE